MRAPRESGERGQCPNTCTAGPGAKERHQREHSSQLGHAEDRRPWWLIWWGRHQKRNASEHPRHEQRPSESQLEKQLERRCHQHRAGGRDGRSQRQRGRHWERRVTARLSDEQIEKKGGKNSAVHNARVDPG